ncbi:hypothetical protein EV644_113145 [Kribbella orskensis]|uniref:Integral membrane protein n=1 Tax=Kribbella orskensis TaxID=2512216 RepID=A0ABY2BGN6_9ACTN|nr:MULTISPECIES: hypothetical protein [Kribbella]TCN36676.1 hypothetical protein EV642_114144 [Kribbella sp. VKM Ac-2500]TCO17915.1 hypothetical protein EV644_113145 [Kribbella orskensis]
MTDEDEVRRLRERVAQLELALAAGPRPPTPESPQPRERRVIWRTVASAILITLACLLAPLSATAVWASRQVSDTDQYLKTVAPLADDPSVQTTISDAVTNEILAAIDIQGITDEALNAISQQGLPPRVAANLQALSGPLVSGVQSFIRDQVANFVASPEFAAVWEQANQTAHSELVNLLEGNQGGALSAQNDTVTLNLAPIIAQVKERLVARGFGVAENIPVVNKSIVLVQSDGVTKAQGIYRLLNTLGVWLPIISLLLFAAGVYVARNHRRALLIGALGFAGSMLALGVGLALGRALYLNALPSEVISRETGGVIFDTIVRYLRYSLRAVGVLALIVAFAAFFTGPSVSAVKTRAGLTRGIGALRGNAESAGLNTGRFGAWTFAHKRMLLIASIIGGALVLTFWSQPTVSVVVVIALIVLFLIAVIEFLGRPPAAAPVAGGTGPSAPA